MKNFLKNAFAAFIGSTVAIVFLTFATSIIFTAIIVAALGDAFSSSQSDSPKVKANSVLHLKLNRVVSDRPNENDFDFSAFGIEGSTGGNLTEILDKIKSAKEDSKIKGIYMEGLGLSAGSAMANEIRDALEDFKSSGKFIYAYSEIMTQPNYYIASVADSIFIAPEGIFMFQGLNLEITFYKKMLDKLGIEAVIYRGRDNEFKSAVEPFIAEKLSESNRLQLTELSQGIWGDYLTKISVARGINQAELNTIADNLSATTPSGALDKGLVDGLLYESEVKNIIAKRVGTTRDSLKLYDFWKYEPKGASGEDFLAKRKKKRNAFGSDSTEPNDSIKSGKIAIVYAEGVFVSGRGQQGDLGSDRYEPIFRKLADDTTVSSVVLRINSPGGSAIAGDILHNAVKNLGEKKPVVVSMSNLAASAGYMIAAPAQYIYAMPNTITGSIGIFAQIPGLEKFLDNKIGITFDRVKTNRNSDYLNSVTPIRGEQAAVFQNYIDNGYNDFLLKVANGRNMPVTEVEKLAKGRVYNGLTAKEIGLVDELGNLYDAIEKAKELAGLTEFDLEKFPKKTNPFEEFFRNFNLEARSTLENWIIQDAELLNAYRTTKSLKEMKGPQARMPFDITIR
ncbi:MAG: signal peptide peptidase SppA [Luteibaculaceae bacterium]